MAEPSVQELSTQLIAWARNREASWPDESPVFRWERWIREDPERGWAVLQQLVDRAPRDSEVMFQAAFRVPQLLSRDFRLYCERVLALLRASSYLDALLGPEVFIEAEYAPRSIEHEHLARAWLRHSRDADLANWPEQLNGEDPELRLRIAVEIIRRGPIKGFGLDDVSSTLLDVLRKFGDRVIDDIESAAQRFVAVRLAIWDVRHSRCGGGLTPDVPVELWARFQAAAGSTNLCNTRLPVGELHPLAPLEEQFIEAWFVWNGTFWASSELNDLVSEEPERAWAVILAIVRRSETAEERAYCGAGPLEDLIRANPAEFIDRVEALAQQDEKFRETLAATWITLEDVPEPLARRYFGASGTALKIIDAQKDWSRDDPGNSA